MEPEQYFTTAQLAAILDWTGQWMNLLQPSMHAIWTHDLKDTYLLYDNSVQKYIITEMILWVEVRPNI